MSFEQFTKGIIAVLFKYWFVSFIYSLYETYTVKYWFISNPLNDIAIGIFDKESSILIYFLSYKPNLVTTGFNLFIKFFEFIIPYMTKNINDNIVTNPPIIVFDVLLCFIVKLIVEPYKSNFLIKFPKLNLKSTI